MIGYGVLSQAYYPLVDTGKTWSTVHYYGTPPWSPTGSDYVKFGADTAINGLVYKKVWKCTDPGQVTWTANGFIREESKKVFYKSWAGGSSNNLIYDFGAQTGDTVILFDDPMGSFLVVDSVGTMTLLSGETRRALHLSCYWGGGGGPIGGETWVEGMGCLSGVLQSGSCILIGDSPHLLCFHEHDTLKYFNNNYPGCFVITGIKNLDNQRLDIHVLISPADGHMVIRVNEPAALPVQFELIDLLGRRTYKQELNTQETILNYPPTSSLPLMIYKATGRNGMFSTGIIANYPD
jgi:hypothetical protein